MADRKRRSNSSSGRRNTSRHSMGVDTDKNISARQKKRRRKQAVYARRRRMLASGIILAVLVIACVLGFATRRNGSEVFFNEQSMGIIKNRSMTTEDMINSVAAKIEESTGTKVKIKDDIEVKGVHVNGKTEAQTSENILFKLRDLVHYDVDAYAIEVNNKAVAVLKSEEEAKEVLSYLNSKFVPEGISNADITYVEDVKIVNRFVGPDLINTLDDAKNKIVTGESKVKTYTVKSGDTPSAIASKHGMSYDEFLELNSTLKSNPMIYVGQEFAVRANEPFITVKAVVTTTEREVKEKEIEYQYDDTKNKSYKKIIKQGTNGEVEVTKQQTYINGILQDEKVVSSNTVTEPVKEIVCVGTR